MKDRKRNGQHKIRYSVRWWEGGVFRGESTGTGDATQAEDYRKNNWAELNIPGAAPTVPEPVEETAPDATWEECRKALQRAMEADKLRASYVADALLMLESVRKTFPEAASPADITPDMANEYKRRRSEDARGLSAWTIRGDLSTLKAIFGKWLGKECGLLDPDANPFANVKALRAGCLRIKCVSVAGRYDLMHDPPDAVVVGRRGFADC